MQATKLQFSTDESLLMANKAIILTKNEVIEKIYTLMGQVCSALEPHWQALSSHLPNCPQVPPKISKGEKHEGMPWVVLDYPRVFSSSLGYCALRTFFWWGHYFSIQWMVSGTFYKHLYGAPARPAEIWPVDLPAPIWAGVPADVWSCAVPQPGLQPVLPGAALPLPKLLPPQVFKCIAQVPLDQWAELPMRTAQFLGALTQGRYR